MTKLSKELIVKAANCGIDARNFTVQELKAAVEKQNKDFGLYADQHLMRLNDAVKQLK